MNDQDRRTELEKLEAGDVYCFLDPEVVARKESAVVACRRFNDADPADVEGQTRILRELFGSAGASLSVQQPFRCDYGPNIHVGDGFLANYNVTILDIAPVVIGHHVMIGPNTLITTVGHPLDPAGRRKKLGQASPVHIGNDVWLGGNVVVLPGAAIGNNVVVAAGAVVSKDIPDNCVVGGAPARTLRELNARKTE